MTTTLGVNPGGFMLPLPSTAHRSVAVSSKAHFCGHIVIGDGSGRGQVSGTLPRVLQVESHLELCWALCLSLRHDIADLREQVAFEWFDQDGEVHTHYFDLFVTRTDGSRQACAVRPVVRAGGRFLRTISRIASQVRTSGFAENVRLLTDHALDPIELHNAWLLHQIRVGDPRGDAAAAQVLADMSGTSTLADLTARTELGARGFRALLRLIRSGHLRLLESEKITQATTVYKGANLQ